MTSIIFSLASRSCTTDISGTSVGKGWEATWQRNAEQQRGSWLRCSEVVQGVVLYVALIAAPCSDVISAANSCLWLTGSFLDLYLREAGCLWIQCILWLLI